MQLAPELALTMIKIESLVNPLLHISQYLAMQMGHEYTLFLQMLHVDNLQEKKKIFYKILRDIGLKVLKLGEK
jgi:hypothetical protein